MFLIVKLSLTTRVLNFSFLKERVNEYTGLIIICQNNLSVDIFSFLLLAVLWLRFNDALVAVRESESIVTPRGKEGSDFSADPSEGIGLLLK